MKQNKVLSLLGLAAKGRNLVSGESQTKGAVIDGSAMLVIVAEDASANTKKLFSDKCSYYNAPISFYGTKEALGKAIGKDFRSSLAICDEGLAKAVIKHLSMGAPHLDHAYANQESQADCKAAQLNLTAKLTRHSIESETRSSWNGGK